MADKSETDVTGEKENSDERNVDGLRECEPLHQLLSQVPRKAQFGILKTRNLILTCIDADEAYITLGTNVGLVFLYSREDNSMQRLRTNNTEDVITCTRLHQGMDFQIAFGTATGHIHVFCIPGKLSEAKKNQTRKFDVLDVHNHYISAIEWSTNGMKLFTGDTGGHVVTTEVDFHQNVCKSALLLVETGTEIVQLDYNHKSLLVSTKQKSFIIRTDKKCEVVTVGTQNHRMSGTFGSCFVPGQCKTDDAHLYAARAGCRIWFSDMKGNVNKTVRFPAPLSPAMPEIPLLQAGKLQLETQEFQFGNLMNFRDNELVTWSSTALVILDPSDGKVIAQQSRLSGITDVAVVQSGEIFVLRKHADARIIRISDKPEKRNLKAAVHIETPLIAAVPTEMEKKEEKENMAKSFFMKAFAKPLKTFDNFVHEDKGKDEFPEAAAPVTLPVIEIDGRPFPPQPEDEATSLMQGTESPDGQVDSNVGIVFSHRMKKKRKKPRKEKSDGNLSIGKDEDTMSINSNTSVTSDDYPHTPQMPPNTPSSDSALSVIEKADNMLLVYRDLLHNDPRSQSPATEAEPPLVFANEEGEIPSASTQAVSALNFPDTVKESKPSTEDKESGSDLCDKKSQSQSPASVSQPSIADKEVDHDLHDGKSQSHSEASVSQPSIVDKEDINDLHDGKSQSHSEASVSQPSLVDKEDINDLHDGKSQSHSETFELKISKDAGNCVEQMSLSCDPVKEMALREKEPLVSAKSYISKQEAAQSSPTFSTEASAESIHSERHERGTSGHLAEERSLDYHSDVNSELRLIESSDPFNKNLKRGNSGDDDFYSQYLDSYSGVFEESTRETFPPIPLEDPSPAAGDNSQSTREGQDIALPMLANSWSEFSTPANIYSLSMSNNHIWFTDKSENIYYSSLSGPQGIMWRKATGQANQISVSSSGQIVWRLHKNAVFAGTKISNRHPEGLKWVEAIREVLYIAVDDDCAWFLKRNGEVMMQRGLSVERPFFKSKKIACSHQLRQIHCHKGAVWAITNELKLLYRIGVTADCPEGTDWELYTSERPPYLFSNVAIHVTDQTKIGWAVDALGQIWFCDHISDESLFQKALWWQVPLSGYILQDETTLDMIMSLVQKFDPLKLNHILNTNKGGLISGSPQGICFALNFKNNLNLCRGSILGYHWLPAQPAQVSQQSIWKFVCANICHLEWGHVWAQHTNGETYVFKKPNSEATLLQEIMNFSCLSSNPHTVWALNPDGEIKIRVGITASCPDGKQWIDLDLSQLGDVHIVHLSCNSSFVWAVESKGLVYQRIGVKPPTENGLNPVWLPIDSFSEIVFTQVHIGPLDWVVWAIDNRRLIYVRAGITECMPIGSEWIHVAGIPAVDLAVTSSGVWALSPSGEVYFRHGIAKTTICGNYWKKIPGTFTKISASANDVLWAVSAKGQLMCCHSRFVWKQQSSADYVLPRLDSTSSSISEENEWEIV